MNGDDWQKRANLRLLYAWPHAQPGKKLLFMGGELAQEREWTDERPDPWQNRRDRAAQDLVERAGCDLLPPSR